MKSLSDFEEMNGAPSEEDHAISLFVLNLSREHYSSANSWPGYLAS